MIYKVRKLVVLDLSKHDKQMIIVIVYKKVYDYGNNLFDHMCNLYFAKIKII